MATYGRPAKRTFDGLKGERFTVIAEWQGGIYVDIRWEDASNAFEVINVYDYEKGEVTPGMGAPGAVARALEGWYAALGDTDEECKAEFSNYRKHTA